MRDKSAKMKVRESTKKDFLPKIRSFPQDVNRGIISEIPSFVNLSSTVNKYQLW